MLSKERRTNETYPINGRLRDDYSRVDVIRFITGSIRL
jgi:hypothetical protein